ncbi:hypothetical protein ON010_g11879 [Phytophthora cinnamomi]|nr:hypothetical protein ON010_g11879 [Phytophthora cinnamomi]
MAADPNPVVLAPATLYVRFTRRTIEEIFPHILWNEALVQRLIGTQVVYPVGNTFYFGDDNKIHRYDTYVDFVAAFVDVLGNVEDTMAMMESALIRQESMIGDLLEEPPRPKVQGTQRIEVVADSDSGTSESSEGPVGARIDECGLKRGLKRVRRDDNAADEPQKRALLRSEVACIAAANARSKLPLAAGAPLLALIQLAAAAAGGRMALEAAAAAAATAMLPTSTSMRAQHAKACHPDEHPRESSQLRFECSSARAAHAPRRRSSVFDVPTPVNMSLHAPAMLDPLRGADPELQAMADYFLAPDAAPAEEAEEDTENPSPNRITSTADARLKKLKRNERDRQRSFAKRVSLPATCPLPPATAID